MDSVSHHLAYSLPSLTLAPIQSFESFALCGESQADTYRSSSSSSPSLSSSVGLLGQLATFSSILFSLVFKTDLLPVWLLQPTPEPTPPVALSRVTWMSTTPSLLQSKRQAAQLQWGTSTRCQCCAVRWRPWLIVGELTWAYKQPRSLWTRLLNEVNLNQDIHGEDLNYICFVFSLLVERESCYHSKSTAPFFFWSGCLEGIGI